MRVVRGWKSKRTDDARPDGVDFLVECDQNVPDEKSERGDWRRREWSMGYKSGSMIYND